MGEVYAMDANLMILIKDKATIIPPEKPAVSVPLGMCPLDPSQAFNPSLGTATGLIPVVAKSTWVQCVASQDTTYEDESDVAGGNPHSIASYSGSSGFINTNLT